MNFRENHWNEETYGEFIEYLKEHQDIKYRDFHRKIITKDPSEREKIQLIGIRTPVLKKIAGEIFRGSWKEYLLQEKKEYYEETVIRGFVIGKIKDIDEFIEYTKIFVKEIDNWAVCDLFLGKSQVVEKNEEKYLKYIKTYENSENPWEVRFLLVALLGNYIQKDYLGYIFSLCDRVEKDYYYVKMAIAWLVSIAFVKFPEETKKYLKKNNLTPWTNNKAIQKIRESLRVTPEEKENIKKYKK